ncbi:acetyl-CoA carboxylase biotin carboxylase subunit [Ramlibacter sp. AW1]|uniref:biotin carboxylase n=1 Tax=Ramlibacter aurantiacus TaxID=2801330 RepID=A0A936ZNH0_9BURK|nr:acetyl-CoA carboxylase biotin carboxylase subunit [Ramlibacter aurantiacus]MBL0423418.1 acetyl-CoA carboxylase biotin carboxylase subunit [Ramlibacter aurantiacus]
MNSIKRVLVANRGEIALRIIRACEKLGIESVLAVSTVDRDSLPARTATRAVCIGPGEASGSYLNVNALLSAADGRDCDAVHPGYGFLSESQTFAQACEDKGLRFVGPTSKQIGAMGNKLQARALAVRCGIPVLSGTERIASLQEALAEAERVGYPVMFKAAAGGGGRGMKIVPRQEELRSAFVAASNESRSAFGDDTLYLERYVSNARHVEVQILGDGKGHVVHLGDRDCSVQRRHQKLIEEAPAPFLSEELHTRIFAAALKLGREMSYRSAGTVEFLVDADAEAFYFLEMNTRIQVEHPVTEMVTGIDLVEQQLRIAAGEGLQLDQADITCRGHSIECRINAEDPDRGFAPSPGVLLRWEPPAGAHIRLDSHCTTGYKVPPHYDSLLGKLIVTSDTRDSALDLMGQALAGFAVEGIHTTIPFLRRVVGDERFSGGQINTRLLDALLVKT